MSDLNLIVRVSQARADLEHPFTKNRCRIGAPAIVKFTPIVLGGCCDRSGLRSEFQIRKFTSEFAGTQEKQAELKC